MGPAPLAVFRNGEESYLNKHWPGRHPTRPYASRFSSP